MSKKSHPHGYFLGDEPNIFPHGNPGRKRSSTETDDGNGNIVETETTVTQTYLYITVSHKTAEEMADAVRV